MIVEKKMCCGCTACVQSCPKKCISMKENKEGFKYPVIDETICIKCGICKKVCPILSGKRIQEEPLAYACRNKDEALRAKSSSGGIFITLCKWMIEQGGIVFGAAFDKNFKVRHQSADSLQGCQGFMGSKYVESDIGEVYREVRSYLEKGRPVLFSGTPCQNKGLKSFLSKDYDKLYCIEIICHGVPSPKVFELYKRALEVKYQASITDIKFRDKQQGWRNYSIKVSFSNGDIYSKASKEELFMQGFLNNIYLRESCHNCSAKNFTSGADISIGDLWKVQNTAPDLDDDKGISLVIVHSKKAQKMLEANKQFFIYRQIELGKCRRKNSVINKSVIVHKTRSTFFNEIDNEQIEILIQKCLQS